MKSFIFTLAFGVFGVLVWFGLNLIIHIDSLVAMIIFIAAFAGVGFLIGALKIPDSPIMGVFRKAGGEYLSDIIFRAITFKRRKKRYIYNYNREKSITKEMKREQKEDNE